MKKLILLFTLVLGSALYKVADAQVGINVNIGSQPVWGPSGYDYAEYYYFPDIDVYYNIPQRQFIYFDRGNWISAYSLPPFCSNYDLFNSYKVVINEPNPFMRNDYWRSRYSSYRGRRQDNIYNSRDPKYFVINEHPQHGRWLAERNNNPRYNDNRQGNFSRNDDRNGDRRYDNNQRRDDVSRNDRDDRNRNDNNRNNNYQRPGNRRWNENDERGNDRFNNGRRN